jgi:hypothetical protein
MADNSEIISLMQRIDHLAHSILQLSRKYQALLDGVLSKANLLWNQREGRKFPSSPGHCLNRIIKKQQLEKSSILLFAPL